MSTQQPGRAAVALLGVIAAAIVVALFGLLQWTWREGGPETASTAAPSSAPSAPPSDPQQQAAAVVAPPVSPTAPLAAPLGVPLAAPPAPPEAPKPTPQPAASDAVVPSFDVVRIEPNGESVIAGRGAPGATIELLRDGQVHARAAADASGLFALVPPALPPGSHQITLQAIAPDGKRERSRDSVAVVISEDRNKRPLVALASPDKPTVLLSNPEPPEPKVAQAPERPAPDRQAGIQPAPSAAPATTPAANPPAAPNGPRSEVSIATVEAEDNGRLYVSGQASPGATVRLYLNDTFIAPGGVGGDGKVSFAIGRGIKPGDYRIRLDDVDPVSGSVKSRAEVAFNVPVPVTVPPVPPIQPPAANVPSVAAAPASPAPVSPPPVTPAPSQVAAAPPASVVPPAPAPSPDASATASGNPRVASAVPPRDLPPGTVVIPDVNTAIISRGDNLWRISQRIYGQGLRYTEIYGANRGQIRNPNLIYPGQVFVVPGEGAPKQN